MPAIMARLSLIKMQPKHILLLDEGSSLKNALISDYPTAKLIEAYSSLEPGSMDWVVANLTLPWCSDLLPTLAAWRYLLKPEGLLMVTMLGPDTLMEWGALKKRPLLMDMHNLGDALVQAGFQMPVLDVDYVTLSYGEEEKCRREMMQAGMFADLEMNVKPQRDENGRIPLTIELVFGHAFSPLGSLMDSKGEVSVPLSQISR